MATDMPPHNLIEIVTACIHLLERPSTDLDALLKILPAPDFPTTAYIVSSKNELYQM